MAEVSLYREFIENCALLGSYAASSGYHPEARSSRLLSSGNLETCETLFLSSVNLFPKKNIRSASFCPHASQIMRIISRFLEGPILLPSSRPALCVYRVILQGFGLRSMEEGFADLGRM